MTSLLDLVRKQWVSWYVVYMETPAPRFWKPFLQRGFYHVQLWRPERFGPEVNDIMWLVVDPGMESANAHVVMDPVPPWQKSPTEYKVQYVEVAISLRRIRDWFHVGPITCVELAKAFLGIRSFFVRTPYQLYKYVSAPHRAHRITR